MYICPQTQSHLMMLKKVWIIKSGPGGGISKIPPFKEQGAGFYCIRLSLVLS